jgi:hypothetical protein
VKVKRFIVMLAALSLLTLPVLTGCTETDADVAAKNISKAAEQFEVARDIVGINGITGEYLWQIKGFCSVETAASGLQGALEVTCKEGKGKFRKLFFGLSDNTTYVVQQIDPINVSTTRIRVIFKPETLIPNIDRP